MSLGAWLALVCLAAPGTAAGFSLLLAHAGVDLSPIRLSPVTHGMLQTGGFFVFLVWGFLVHGLSGILGADAHKTARVLWPMNLLAVSLLLVITGEVGGWPSLRTGGVWGAVFGSMFGNAVLWAAALGARESWLARPTPLLLLPLWVFPLAWLLVALGIQLPFRAGDLALLGGVIPVLLSMAYRVLPPLTGLQFPRERLFDVSALAWVLGSSGALLLSRGWNIFGELLMFAASVGFAISLGIYGERRTLRRTLIALDAMLLLYVRVAFVFFVAGCFLRVVAGRLPGLEFYWRDFALHALSIGFALLIVIGITLRMLPTFLRRKPSSPLGMRATLVCIVLGLGLRAGEAFLPAAQWMVRAAAVFLYAGVLMYAVQLARGLLVRATPAAGSPVKDAPA